MSNDQLIRIGGQSFRPITEPPNFRHDTWLLARLIKGGLVGLSLNSGETEEQLMWRMTAQAAEADVLFELLGGLLVPADLTDAEWTPEMALATAAHFAAQDEPAERTRRNGLLAEVLFPFWQAAIASPRTSRNSLRQATAAKNAIAAPSEIAAHGA